MDPSEEAEALEAAKAMSFDDILGSVLCIQDLDFDVAEL